MVLRIGHRGTAGHAPENTLLSFSMAVELGCDMTELDAHICGSGELVVIHDESVDRTTDGTGRVSKLSLSELMQLETGLGEKIPTLEEVLRLLKDRIMLNIELKGLGTPEPVYNLVDSLGWQGEFLLITSFDWDMLSEYRMLDHEALIGPLTYDNLYDAMGFAEEVNAHCINPHHGHIDEDYLKLAHLRDFKVYPWTVNEPEDIEHIIGLGVDGVISDYPDRIPHKR